MPGKKETDGETSPREGESSSGMPKKGCGYGEPPHEVKITPRSINWTI